MAEAALRFLAHCLEMTLPVSLSTSASRGRIFIFSFSCSFLWCHSAVVSLLPQPHSLPGFLSPSLCSQRREPPRHCFPRAAGVGDGTEGRGRKGGR